ncbi:chitin deacetylase 1-like [Amphibalanus amphitrite]|uniref:chitin deacetylase 1-like n=1 Tax=Amphibalanus amphitrite TaxID=1232801 RepID=UPI001C91D49B|nr:chitin deacetylase 1-like [Amphibalanus amphitrite]
MVRVRGALLAAGLLCLAAGQNLPDSGDFECPQSDGMFADPTNCRKFYSCVDSYPHSSLCPAGLHWHAIDKQCTYKNLAVCGPQEIEVTTTTPDPYAASACDPARCSLTPVDPAEPGCFCSKDGTRIPGDIDPKETPQMVILSLDGAVNGQNYEHYLALFNDTVYKNPNECPMRATFFVSHEYSNYQMVQDLYHKGHEIAVNSITSRQLQGQTYEEWVQEMVGMRSMLAKWANVSEFDIFGMRAPRLKPGDNRQFDVLLEHGFAWDSSIPVPPLRVPIWPYTLDYKISHECRSGGCPTSQYPGVWEIPLNSHYVQGYDGGHCPYLDQCVLFNYEPAEILTWFKEDFNRHYESNRAPYQLSFHTNWFNEANLIEGLNLFLQWLNQKDDVWFVTMTQALYWMTDPIPINQLAQLDQWDCRKRKDIPEPACNLPNTCRISFKPPKDGDPAWVPGTRYFTTCFSCPKQYPWLYDSDGDAGQPDIYESVQFKK